MIRLLWFGHNWSGDNFPENRVVAFSRRSESVVPNTIDNYLSIGLFSYLGKMSQENEKKQPFAIRELGSVARRYRS